ncbi:hypothetical protein AB0P17_40440 [Streptomyces sp. NPDC088124]|uniref:hypothetical protein n=1 Tax=Streptomyces sp. NPDC088124 TaxID=3154654 RepID=UPI0034244EF6
MWATWPAPPGRLSSWPFPVTRTCCSWRSISASAGATWPSPPWRDGCRSTAVPPARPSSPSATSTCASASSPPS